MQEGKVIGVKERCLEGEENIFFRERSEKMKTGLCLRYIYRKRISMD